MIAEAPTARLRMARVYIFLQLSYVPLTTSMMQERIVCGEGEGAFVQMEEAARGKAGQRIRKRSLAP